MLLQLLKPLSLLLSLSILLAFVIHFLERHELERKIASGLIYGIIAVVAMMTPYDFFPGFIFDSRSVIVSLSGFFGGPIVATPAIILAASYRLYLGGTGAIAGALVVFIAGAVGIGYYYIRNRYKIKIKVWHFLAFGFITHFLSIFGLAVLPWEIMWKVIRKLSIPFFSIYPFLTVFLGIIIHQIELHFEDKNKLAQSERRYKDLYDDLMKSEKRFKKMIEKSPLPMSITDGNQDILFFNDKFTELFGYTLNDVSTAEKWWEIAYPDDEYRVKVQESWMSAIKKAEKEKTDIPMQTWDLTIKDRTKRSCEFYMVPLGETSLIIVNDITNRKLAEKERKHLEQQLHQAQKLESIGTLAGGIAHDFNNILYPIIGFTEISIEDLAENHPVQENLNDILQGAKRASELVNQILSFSKQRDLEKKTLPFQPLIEETLKLLRSIIPSNIEIKKEFTEESINIFANTTEIHEVIMNLSTNAYHAMEEHGGTLKISLKKEQPGMEHNLSPGEYCCLSIHDTGYGISPEIINDIFDPYFTTKKQGKGTGLGLSVIHGIINNYKGTIDIKSKIDEGTLVKVYLPLSSKKDIDDNTFIPPETPTGNEKILFVDDEEMIVKLGVRILQKIGYTVTGETSSEKAIKLFRSKPKYFDLVITDMTMPFFLGTDLARKMLEIRKDIPILLCTGFSERIDKKTAQSIGIKGYIHKPILLEELATKVRELLDLAKED